eukprot:TRINITY_DN10655_c0_g1_i5.p1 TRINITY_DN10655_c0_g1~~TRINITY_DN10655_c0_g1_i5.p1  ORF type:complete len:144 (-),score=19.13 TRINITY_DN10655_c0_g1_i5:1041-1472(-)
MSEEQSILRLLGQREVNVSSETQSEPSDEFSSTASDFVESEYSFDGTIGSTYVPFGFAQNLCPSFAFVYPVSVFVLFAVILGLCSWLLLTKPTGSCNSPMKVWLTVETVVSGGVCLFISWRTITGLIGSKIFENTGNTPTQGE